MSEPENKDERVAGASPTPPPVPEESSQQLPPPQGAPAGPPPPGPYLGPPVGPPPPGRWHRVRGWGARRSVQLVGAGLIGAIIGGVVVGAIGAANGEGHGHYRMARPGYGAFGWGPWGGERGPMPYMPCFGRSMPGGPDQPDQQGGPQDAQPGPYGWGPMMRCRMLPPQQQPVQPPQGQATPASPAPPATPTPVPSPSKS